uniref:Rho GTPase activating protein 30 n=1 Tax=Panthera tigris altaica TaxID=74533 RepID=A0A8C9L174_PANTA
MKSRQKGKKKGSSKERVFGCDLQEQLQRSGQEVPQVLRSCAEFVEEYGVVDGIYRLSGVSSNIQKLRTGRFRRSGSVLRGVSKGGAGRLTRFLNLPPHQEAVAVQLEPERLIKILEVLGELPLPNYRTLEFLTRHLVHMASFSAQTNMHARNLAIVWAPNLLRSKDIEASGFNGTAAFMEVRVQSIVVEFILTHVDQLFGGAALSKGDTESKSGWRSLPGARASGSPEDLMPRSLPYNLPSILQAGDGPPQIRPYHTIIEIAEHKRKGSLKVRKWKSIFNLGRSGHEAKRKLPRGAEDREDKSDKGTLRPAKSMDSLSAAAGVSDGEYRCARGVCAGLDPCVPGTAFLSTDEKLEASSAAGPPADCGPADVAPALEDCLSQEVQDSFSFLEDSSSSEPEWVGVEDGEVAEAGTAGTAFSPGEDDPGMGYPEELLRVGPQVEEFSVEPPLDDLSLDEAQFVLAPSCRSPDSAGPGPEGEEESGEEVFLSAYDDLSPLLGPRHPNWEGPGSLEEEAAGCRGRGPPGQAEGEQACREGGEDREAEPEGRRDVPEEAVPQPPRPQEMEPGGPLGPEGCNPCPCPLGSAGGVGMRLASSLVQVQQVRSVPVVPPKPQFAKMPSAMCSKIHVAPANPCPRPGRLDGTPGERAWGSRASRSSWRNGGSLSFDAAVALARDRQRTEAQGIRRTQTCTGGGDYSLIPRTSPCSVIPAYSRPLSCLGLPPEEDTEGSGHRSRLSLPPREPQPPDPLLSPQRRSYAFETQANPGRGEGL